jgi:hypothetical protein
MKTTTLQNETRRAIHSRICARWHAGLKNFSTAGLNEPRIECTGDLYNWLENLTDVEVLDALEAQTI